MTEKLRCWPGCVAVIIRSRFPQNIWKRVKVIRSYPHEVKNKEGHIWETIAEQEMLGYDVYSDEISVVNVGDIGINSDIGLMPITPDAEILAEETDIGVVV